MSEGIDIRLTPRGQLVTGRDAAAPPLPPDVARLVEDAFADGSGAGLWALGSGVVGTALPQPWSWWRDLAASFVSAVCLLGEAAGQGPVEPPDAGERQRLCWSVPPMVGAEYLDEAMLLRLWREMDAAFKARLGDDGTGSVDALMQRCHPSWHLVGRVHVHLAENRKDEACPFAFLVTYTAGIGARGTARHLPLAQALKEYAGDHDRLITLLEPLSIAARDCAWLQPLLDRQEIFHPLRWTAGEALQFLRDAERLRASGVIVRLPAAWRSQRPARVLATGTVGSRAPSQVGTAALVDFQVDVAIDGEALDQAEVERLLAGSDGLQWIRGRWVEVDRERLQRTLQHFDRVQAMARSGGLGFHEAMRLLAEGDIDGDGAAEDTREWISVRAGAWLEETLRELRQPSAAVETPRSLRADLRPYQIEGLRWLHLLAGLRLGACLADDMGLGKTIQVLALLLLRKEREGAAPSLLVAPASLLANWAAEAERFAPDLRFLIAHGSAMGKAEVEALDPSAVAGYDLVIVSYGSLHRWAWLQEAPWRLVVLDEAQAIKNRATRQTRAAKKLPAESRIILTGTPVENHLGDLWSLFDFVNPGLLGSAKAFTAWSKRLRDAPEGYAPLRRLVQPYLLRRLKTDKDVIADLPDKVEQTVWCALSRKQGALYQQAVDQLRRELDEAEEGIARRGLVLAYLLRFKQICNHPSQWLGDDDWQPRDSGKFGALDDLCSTIAERQEKALVFTQFRETTAPLAAHLASRFGRDGLILTGATPVGKRRELVRRFQEDDRVPFFVISLKAGGSGLNLTAANHVIHFDRWWNPAVENQATDRAFRIGQHRNVLVHKFTCRGTVEERIAAMIADKQTLADELFDAKGEIKLTELGDDEILDLVTLDARAYTED